MGPDYFQRLFTANYPALASYGRLPSAWAPAVAPTRPRFMGQPVETPEERSKREQWWADGAAKRAEKKFESFRSLCRVVDHAQSRAVSRVRLEQALEHSRTGALA